MSARKLMSLETVRFIWLAFQTLGFAGLIGNDNHKHGVWDVLAPVGFGVAIPMMCVYLALRWRETRHRQSPRRTHV